MNKRRPIDEDYLKDKSYIPPIDSVNILAEKIKQEKKEVERRLPEFKKK